MTGFAIVSTTLDSVEAARALAHILVEAKLAACGQILPVESVYQWKGAIETAQELLLLCKITAEDFPAVSAIIGDHHSYETPEIVMTPIVGGATPYLDWLRAATRR